MTETTSSSRRRKRSLAVISIPLDDDNADTSPVVTVENTTPVKKRKLNDGSSSVAKAQKKGEKALIAFCPKIDMSP